MATYSTVLIYSFHCSVLLVVQRNRLKACSISSLMVHILRIPSACPTKLPREDASRRNPPENTKNRLQQEGDNFFPPAKLSHSARTRDCYFLLRTVIKNVMIVRICFYGAWDFLDDDVGRVVGKVTAGRDGDWPVGCCFCRQLPINNLARMCTSQQSRKRVIASYNVGKGFNTNTANRVLSLHFNHLRHPLLSC